MTQIKMMSTRRGWDGIVGQTRTRAGQIVRKAALDAQAAAQAGAPVDTGALRASVFTVSAGASGYAASAAAVDAQAAAGQKRVAQFPPYEIAGTTRAAFAACVVVGVEYGYWVETGTTRRAARPFLLPAVEAQRGPFVKALQALLGPAEGADLTLSPGFARDVAAGAP